MSSILKYILLLIVSSSTSYAQNSRFIALGKLKASTTHEKIEKAMLLQDLSTDFWEQMAIPYELRQELEKQRLLASAQGYYVYPPDKNLGKYITISGATLTVMHDGIAQHATVESADINPSLRKILSLADVGSDLVIQIVFKDPKETNSDSRPKKIVEAQTNIHVVPQHEAEFPGGYTAMTDYLFKNILSQFPEGRESFALAKARVSFNVNEDGLVKNVKMRTSSGDKKIDEFIIRAIQKMPTWKPAQENNIKVKQEFTVPFNGDGC